MFGWFKKPKRKIFKFFDGAHNRLADPLKVFLYLKSHPEFKIESDPKLADLGHPGAIRRMVQAAREAFQIHELANGGLTDGEVLDVLAAFIGYMEDVKKKSSPTLTQ